MTEEQWIRMTTKELRFGMNDSIANWKMITGDELIKIDEEQRAESSSNLIDLSDKKSIRDALDKASSMNPYEVIGKPETYSQYNAGWQDAVDYLSQLLGIN